MEVQRRNVKPIPQPREPTTSWTCDECDKPGRLYRFRCTVCPDYNWCLFCYSRQYHPHHMKMINESLLKSEKTEKIYSCDGCQRNNAPIRFRCANGCDFDFCSDCYLQKDHSHQMKYVGGTCSWCCNGCGSNFSGNRAYRFRCVNPGCDFDFCKNCINKKTHAHPLKLLYGFQSFFCDGCGEWNRSSRFRCTVCEDVDYCDKCYLRKTHPPSHSFRMMNANMSYFCDICDASCAPDRHRCTVCDDFDLCGKCYFANKHPQHQMKKFALDILLTPFSPSPVEVKPLLPSPSVPKKVNLPPPNIENEDLSCVVCMENPRNSVIIHGESGHEICCLSCAKKLKQKNQGCPICRQQIENVVKVFK